MSYDQQAAQMRTGKGFVAALDQSGGSTPKALLQYGIEGDRYNSDAEMFDLVHAMRTRIVGAPAFTGDKVIGAILFEMTMDREFFWQASCHLPLGRKRRCPLSEVRQRS